ARFGTSLRCRTGARGGDLLLQPGRNQEIAPVEHRRRGTHGAAGLQAWTKLSKPVQSEDNGGIPDCELRIGFIDRHGSVREGGCIACPRDYAPRNVSSELGRCRCRKRRVFLPSVRRLVHGNQKNDHCALTTMDLGLQNKIALVTAASQGLGKAAAAALAR